MEKKGTKDIYRLILKNYPLFFIEKQYKHGFFRLKKCTGRSELSN